jgi:RNA polymerase sigma-70 factor (ECF subfamily)
VTRSQLQTEEFERQRQHLQAVAYRMLGSASEAEDAVQEAWLRLQRSEPDSVDNLGGWLTTVVARVALDMLRARRARREDYVGDSMPEPIVTVDMDSDPEQRALLADSVGLALLVVLDTLSPSERLAFVLHDMFGIRFDEIAQVLDRSPQAARQLANRARHKVRAERTEPDPDLEAQREVVDAFLAAAREGDFERLIAVLDPDVVSRGDFGPGTPLREARGAEAVASNAVMFQRLGLDMRPALVNGAVGAVSMRDGKPFSIGAITVRDGKIVEMDFFADPERLAQMDLTILDA